MLGAVARAALAQALPAHGGHWPWGTLAANVSGALLLGAAEPFLLGHGRATTYRWRLWATGLCGALTTFSTVQVELLRIARHDHAGLAVGYGAVSVAACLTALVGAMSLARRVRRG
jgi:CrcB protein